MKIEDFLLTRIAEDEAVANQRDLAEAWEPYAGSHNGLDSTHDGLIVRPARILAECAAKRILVDWHTRCDDVSYGDASTCPELCTLAAVYAEHPDYNPTWR